MAYTKGQSGNPQGRPKGAKGKYTSTIRKWIVELINKNREQIEKDFLQLEAKDRLQMIEKFLPYIMPKVEKADEVEGACYESTDFEPDDWTTCGFDKKRLRNWYEK